MTPTPHTKALEAARTAYADQFINDSPPTDDEIKVIGEAYHRAKLAELVEDAERLVVENKRLRRLLKAVQKRATKAMQNHAPYNSAYSVGHDIDARINHGIAKLEEA